MSQTTAFYLSSLHKPGSPIVFANIWDTTSLQTILSINPPTNTSTASTNNPLITPSSSSTLKAIATASYAIATSHGIKDEDLTYAHNLTRIRELAPLVKAANLPLSVDLQDGYGARITECIKEIVEAGAVGANIEDVVLHDDAETGKKAGEFYGVEEQVERLKMAIQAAKEAGCPGFVVNARTDAFFMQSQTGKSDEEVLKDVVERGRKYLEAGATTVFVWGGSGRGLRDHEVKSVVKELGGRVAVKLSGQKGGLSVKELSDIGVARISVGPSLSFLEGDEVKIAAQRILGGGALVE